MGKIVVFGSLNMDMSIRSNRMPLVGETISGSDFIQNPGGKGANQAMAAAKMGAKTVMLGSVGAAQTGMGPDSNGVALLTSLKKAGVDTSRVKTVDGLATSVAIIVNANGNNAIVIDSEANCSKDVNTIIEELDGLIQEGDILITQNECDMNACYEAIKFAKEKGAITMHNPAPALKPGKDVIPFIDYLVLNELECQTITGILPYDEYSTKDAIVALLDMGFKHPIITLGAKGSAAISNKIVFTIDAYPVEVVDTTAAGDTYIGALATQLLEEKDLYEAMEFASKAASLATTKRGAQSAIPTREEVENE
ncbi:MAG: ribokinase [Clostridia bacterium]|nr:ribokinase [Clostridia bacterium]